MIIMLMYIAGRYDYLLNVDCMRCQHKDKWSVCVYELS